MTATNRPPAHDSDWFRKVLGHLPTGVFVISGITPEGAPTGLAVGSFTSVSLEPPLVAFLPAKTSTTWPKLVQRQVFCASILGADQEDVCRRLSSKEPDKFAGLPWQAAPSGSPILEGAVAWVDCDIETIHDAGDHDIVIGRVRELGIASGRSPLIFHKGQYRGA